MTNDAVPVTAGPFHVSHSSDGTKHWFSARDEASGVTIPAKDRDDAYAMVSSLNRACEVYAARHRGSTAVVVEALKLADALLRGANMNRAFVERKVSAALASLGEV